MFQFLSQIGPVVRFIQRVVPAEGRTFRFYFCLFNLLIRSRQSIYLHFRRHKKDQLKFRDFLNAIAMTANTENPTLQAILFTRLLRTVYLTEIVPNVRKNSSLGGPNLGFIDHPQFSYGQSLEAISQARETNLSN